VLHVELLLCSHCLLLKTLQHNTVVVQLVLLLQELVLQALLLECCGVCSMLRCVRCCCQLL
jgi:hypothetical protein